jgi:activator of Hsp90 ATPase-like protein
MSTKNVGKLQISTPSGREVAMTRVFDAPRRLVFDAWTRPELIKRWLGVSQEVRDAVLETPMERGIAESYDKLDEVLAALPAREGK